MEIFRVFGRIFIDDRRALDSLDKVDEQATKTTKTFMGMSKAVIAAGAAVGAAAIKIGKEAVTEAMAFEKGMANVATLLEGDVKPRIEALGNEIKDLMGETGQSAQVLNDGLYQVISALGDTAESMDVLEVATKGSVAGMSTVTSSVDLLTATMKGYGDVSVEAAEKVSDLAFMTVKLGVTTFPELAASMGTIIPLAASLKISQEELFGAMATLTGVTGDTNRVTTQLRAAFSNLMRPTENMTVALKKMGYENGAVAVETLGLQGTLDGLYNAVGGNDIAFANLFSSVEAVSGVLALATSQSDNFIRKTEAMGNAAGATDAAYDKMQDTLEGSLSRMKESFNALLIDIGERLIPAIKEVIGLLEDVPAALDAWNYFMGIATENLMRTFSPKTYRMNLLVDALQGTMDKMKAETERTANAQIESINDVIDAETEKFDATMVLLDEEYARKVETADRIAEENRETLTRRLKEERRAFDERMSMLDEEFDRAMENIDAESNARIKALQAELDAIDDKEEADKINDLKRKISTTRNLVRRQEYIKELEQLEKEARKREIRKEIQNIKEDAAEKKDGLRDEYEDKKEAERDKYEATTERLQDELDAIDKYTKDYKDRLDRGLAYKRLIEKNKYLETVQYLKDEITAIEKFVADRNNLLVPTNIDVATSTQEYLTSRIAGIQRMLDYKDLDPESRKVLLDQLEEVKDTLKAFNEWMAGKTAFAPPKTIGSSNFTTSAGGTEISGSGVSGVLFDRYAEGTDYVPRSGRYLVGEKEPEIVDLKRGSSVTPLSKSNTGMVTNITIDNPYIMDDYGVERLLDRMVAILKRKGLNPK